MPTRQPLLALISLLLALSLPFAASAAAGIAVLNFELKDLTLQPDSAQAEAFTAKVAPLLRKTLAKAGLTVVSVPAAAQNKADAGFGYLYQHNDAAAQLGRHYDAAYVAVGRVHRPTFLFQYLKLHLVDVANSKVIGDYEVELKGQQDKLLASGVQQLAQQIEATLKSDSR